MRLQSAILRSAALIVPGARRAEWLTRAGRDALEAAQRLYPLLAKLALLEAGRQ